MTTNEKTQIAENFLTALKTPDPALMRSIIATDAIWSMPGESTISGEAVGIDAILARAAAIRAHGMHFTVERILIGQHGVALSLHNTAEHNGKTFDMHLATVLAVGDGRVTGIATYMHNVEKLNSFFAAAE